MDVVKGFWKLLETVLKLEIAQINLIRLVVSGEVDFEGNDERFPQTSAWLRQCFNRPSDDELIMSAINEITECHGVEAIKLHTGEVLEYCNSGDTYTATVLYFRGKLMVSDWGTIVEKYGAD